MEIGHREIWDEFRKLRQALMTERQSLADESDALRAEQANLEQRITELEIDCGILREDIAQLKGEPEEIRDRRETETIPF